MLRTTAPTAPALGGQLVNGYTFTKSGFPFTGWDGAYFEFKGLKDSNAHDWTYRSTDTSKAIVYNDGNWWGGVKLKAKGSVNIEVYNVAGGSPVTYTINPRKWFIAQNYRGSRYATSQRCESINASQPAMRTELSFNDGVRDIGSLYSEWGNVSSVFGANYMWTSQQSTSTKGFTVSLATGDNDRVDAVDDGNWTVCIAK